MLAAISADRSAVEEDTPSQTPIITTLYELLAALSVASAPGEEGLVTAAVAHLCHTGRLRFLALPHTRVVVCAERRLTRATVGVGNSTTFSAHERGSRHAGAHSLKSLNRLTFSTFAPVIITLE